MGIYELTLNKRIEDAVAINVTQTLRAINVVLYKQHEKIKNLEIEIYEAKKSNYLNNRNKLI